MQVFDTSAIIHAWDNYPPKQFEGLWNWLKQEVLCGRLCLSTEAHQEVRAKLPECGDWLDDCSVKLIAPSTQILGIAYSIKDALGVQGDRYGAGVGEVDIIIIATAIDSGAELVTNEAKQKTLPQKKLSYKIPAVCSMLRSPVPHMDFLSYIKRSKVKF